eukprot:GFUD01022269.1.p1 GENE.GFUD01022269.1~~GFUD01022269.1.p1  ORF type:complete len:511 (+),score=90.91 GFUD01022269.1:17-1549(+)
MLGILWLFSILCFIFGDLQDQVPLLSSFELVNLKSCPFPVPKNIEPCSCKVDEKHEILLICNLDQDMDAELLHRLSNAFACKKEVHLFDINLNGHRWMTDFSPELLGQFKLTKFHLSNFAFIAGDILAGAFNGSLFSLTEFHIETSEEGSNHWNRGVIETGAFSKLQALNKVSLGNSFGKLNTKAFFELPSLQQLTVDNQSISAIESEALYDLPGLKVLNLSNQSITSLPPRAFSNLPNLTELNLSLNMIKQVQDNTFYNLPSLINLDLSKNTKLCHIGNMFSHLRNPNLVVNLAENNVKVLLEDSFKPFIETVTENNGKGHIDMALTPMQCACDVKWLVTSNFEWTGIIQNSSCNDGSTLEEVDGALLEMLCPPENCPGYDAGYGEMYQPISSGENSGILASPGFPRNYPNSIYETYEITAAYGPIDISFSHFDTEPDYDIVNIHDRDGTVLLEYASGSSIPRNIKSKTKNVIVEFTTDSEVALTGWKLKWEGQEVLHARKNQLCECCD